LAESDFETKFSRFVPHELDLFGFDITYRPQNVSANDKTIKCIFQGETRLSNFADGNAQAEYDTVLVMISSKDNSTGHVSPVEWSRGGLVGDVLIINSETWYLREHLESKVAGMHKLLLSNSKYPFVGQG